SFHAERTTPSPAPAPGARAVRRAEHGGEAPRIGPSGVFALPAQICLSKAVRDLFHEESRKSSSKTWRICSCLILARATEAAHTVVQIRIRFPDRLSRLANTYSPSASKGSVS